MPNTHILISSSTVGSGGAASISFSSIPSTYTDLKLVTTLRTNRTSFGDYALVALNSTAPSAYMQSWYSGTLISVTSTLSYNITSDNANGANEFSYNEIYLPNYRSSAAKTGCVDGVVEQNAASPQGVSIAGVLWSVTAPITSISITPRFGSAFQENSTAYLYGIKNS